MITLSESNADSSSESDSDDTSEVLVVSIVTLIAMDHSKYLGKGKRPPPRQSGYQWVMDQLQINRDCYTMFHMNHTVLDRLHEILVENYGLKSTRGMSSVEVLGMFLWMCGGAQSFFTIENIFKRSTETISRKFNEVLESVNLLAGDIIKPKDLEFTTVHPRLQDTRFSPHFNNCIGAIDGTHVRVVMLANELIPHIGRHGYPTQNVMAVCDFDMRFTFVVFGWSGSADDSRVFNDTLCRYSDAFPHPPEEKYYLVDSGYPNKKGYLAPYKGQKYHIPEFQGGRRPSGPKEVFNHAHSSLRNVIERSFGVLEMKWRVLLNMPCFPVEKQKKIIIACIALHNFFITSFVIAL